MLEIKPIPAFNDNYIWLIREPDSNEAWVVDPGDAAPVQKALEKDGLTLAGILVTHHHYDHTDGIDELKKAWSVKAWGADNQHTDIVCAENDTVAVCGYEFRTLAVPGHTLDHVAFYNEETSTLFCGDTLFLGGCGRIFEGTADQMHHSLQKLAVLPDDTQVYCTHEYSLANLKFAQAVEPDNHYVLQAVTRANQLRAENKPTLPTTIADEKCHNPFFRSHQPAVIASATEQKGTLVVAPAEVFAAIRQWKDNF
ncbi:hydroxyacylglutathione hydrolase [Oceanospirillum sediminis]|uniref:Hydroxyacylglutathione hydrolase n=1 Tax=Oceanospirillum sediminis TaxID=2760088 RepID=A0A839IN15_9GAMM|nr:hydroxyacylglutathione hydrolase [Oceanospirillum sediminis]MBB1485867.1 hydroxyacylglutathione hydrolase [Oceanospirillum sediminis]